MAELKKLNNRRFSSDKDEEVAVDAVDSDENLKPARFGIRHLQCFLLFGGLSVGYAMRVNLSVAIVAMTDKNSTNPNFEEFDWNEKTKSLMLSSFFWGYCITQVPCGQLARKYGPKALLLYGNLISAVLAVGTPFLVSLGNWQLLFVVRVIQGLCQGCLFPCTHTMLSKWAPVHERGPLCTYCYAGTLFGSVIMLATSGVLASSPFGWPSIFYASGILGFIWVAGLYVWGANTPDEYKGMPIAEKLYIERSLQAQQEESQSEAIAESELRTPWAKIFTSAPFLALALAHAVHNYCFWTLLTQIPSYMKHILHMDIKSNALLSSLPYATMVLLSFAFCGVSDFLNNRKCVSISTSRKLFNTIGQWIPMTTLIALAYVGQDQVQLAIILLTVTIGLNSASFLGFQVNHIDLSPNFAGVLMGITNCGANIMSVLAPLVVGFIVTNEKDPEQWRIVFFIAGGFYFMGNLLFLTVGQTKIQPWNDPRPAAKEFTLISNGLQVEREQEKL